MGLTYRCRTQRTMLEPVGVAVAAAECVELVGEGVAVAALLGAGAHHAWYHGEATALLTGRVNAGTLHKSKIYYARGE